MTDLLARPLELPCGATLPNRLAKAAMTEGLADAAAEILREALGVAVRGQELSSLRQALASVSDARDQMLTVRDDFDRAWWNREELVGVLMAQCRPGALRLPPLVLDFWTSVYQAIED